MLQVVPVARRLFHVLILSLAGFSFGQSQMRPLPASNLPATEQSAVVGKPSLTQSIHLSIALNPAHPAELTSFADSVSDPGSPNYRHFMTPKQIGEAFGPSVPDVDRVVAYLKSQGMRVTFVSPNRMGILAQATVAQAQKAFSTQLKTFEGPSPEGKLFTFRGHSGAISVPSSIAPAIMCVGGLDTYARPQKRTTLNPGMARALYSTAPLYFNGYGGPGGRIAIRNWDG
jgi:subtilase family serine protease